MKAFAALALLALAAHAADVEIVPGQLSADRSPDGNSVILRGPEGVVLIDTGRGGPHTRNLLERLAGAPVRAVLNTHWHLDHVGGNDQLRAAFPEATLYAHPSLDDALAGFHADNRRQLEQMLLKVPADSASRPRMEAELALLRRDRALAATVPVTEDFVLLTTGRPLEVHVSRRSVTEGDLWFLDRPSRTLIAGDLVTLPVPLFDSACPAGWSDALARLSSVRFRRLVPGHGAPMTPAGFRAWRRGFDRLLACAAGTTDDATCIDGWFADTKSLATDPSDRYARELLSYYLGRFLRPGAAGSRRWCEASEPGNP